ncbi:MAG: SixA phosphatase family protein [Flammeovirgaceae bacterium]
MKTIYLVRHAKSSWKNPNLRDFDRPLNKRGKRDAPFMGMKLKERGLMPDAIISSPAARAKKTAQTIAEKLGFPWGEIEYLERVYDADEEDLLDIIRHQSNKAQTIMLFGHNPEFTWLSNELSKSYIENIPTTGMVRIDFEVDRWKEIAYGKGKLIFFDYPKNYLDELPPK